MTPTNYELMRPKLRSGDMVAWSHRPWRTWYDFQIQMVRMFTRSEYCHVGCIWRAEGRVFVIEAVTPKVRIFPLSKLLPFWVLPMEMNWTEEVAEFALSTVGAEYSKLQAIESFFHPPKADNVWQCAELYRSISEVAGFSLGDDVTPSGIVLAAQRMGAQTILVET